MAPDVSLLKDLLPHLLRMQSGDNLQILASSLITSAAKNRLMQGHTPSLGSPHPMTNEKEGIYRPGHLSTTQKTFEASFVSMKWIGVVINSAWQLSFFLLQLLLPRPNIFLHVIPKSFPKKHQKG